MIAEKYQAMVLLELANSRMKDFYDLAVIARRTDLDGKTLADAIAATFARRNSPLPAVRPRALTDKFSTDTGKRVNGRHSYGKIGSLAHPLSPR